MDVDMVRFARLMCRADDGSNEAGVKSSQKAPKPNKRGKRAKSPQMIMAPPLDHLEDTNKVKRSKTDEDQPSEFTLIYFALNVRGEPIRAMLNHAKVNYDDRHVTFDEWPDLKSTVPSGQLPCLVLPDGTHMSQSLALSRFLGKKYGYYPEDAMEAYECDMLCDAYNDLLSKVYKPYFVKDEAKREQMYPDIFEKALPKFLNNIEPIVERNKWLVGDKMTVADFWIGGLYTNMLANDKVGFARDKFAEVLAKYPAFTAYGERFVAATQDYQDKRQSYPV